MEATVTLDALKKDYLVCKRENAKLTKQLDAQQKKLDAFTTARLQSDALIRKHRSEYRARKLAEYDAMLKPREDRFDEPSKFSVICFAFSFLALGAFIMFGIAAAIF